MKKLRFIDLFCGVGGFRIAMDEACKKNEIISDCLFSSDIDAYCQKSYELNFGHKPAGDIQKINEKDIPCHDVLLAGFPCQPFSIIGNRKGFEDTRGTLFYDIARILKEKQPQAFVLENVKQLVGHNKGQTLNVIIKTLQELGYHTHYKVLNALDYGLPQKRERIIIVGHRNCIGFSFPPPVKTFKPLEDIIEKNVDKKYFASEYIAAKRKSLHTSAYKLAIWHENKSGAISSYPYSCALRAGASYNYLLVNGERRLTPRELFRLQGFPDSYKITGNDAQARKQAGNAAPVNLILATLLQLIPTLKL